MQPNSVRRFDFSLKSVVATIAPGHALRLTITSQADPLDCTGQGSGGPGAAVIADDPCYPTSTEEASFPGTYTVMHGGPYRSSLKLPMLPGRPFRSGGTAAVPVW